MRNGRSDNGGRMNGIQIHYRKNLEHYYLVVSRESDTEEDYQFRMVLENRIRGLIPLEVKCREGRKDLYYDVSSLQPLTRIYDRKELAGADIRKILYGILDVLGQMREYMLEEDNAVLDPAFIFTDMESGTIHLMFLPKGEGENEEEEDPMLPVAEFLMEHADHRDPQAALCAYRIYQTIRKGNYVTEDLRRALEGKEQDPGEQSRELPEEQTEPREQPVEDLWPEICETRERTDPQGKLPEMNGMPVAVKPETAGKEENAKNGVPVIPAAVMILAGILLLSGNIPGWYADGAGKLVAAVIIAAGAGILFLQLRKRRSSGTKDTGAELLTPGGIEEVFADLDPREAFRKEEAGRTAAWGDPYSSRLTAEEAPGTDREENYGKTVFVGAADEPAENILVEKGRKKEYRIDHFPFTIGKKKDCVDLALTDRSVSRIHARILQKNGRTYLQDCRSTNGTFLNGVQLEAEETVMLEREDEIEIGKVKFSYM